MQYLHLEFPPSKQNNQCLSCNRAKELSYGNFEWNHGMVLIVSHRWKSHAPLRLFLLIWVLPSAFPAAGLPDPARMEIPLPRHPAERKSYERKEQSRHMRGESDGRTDSHKVACRLIHFHLTHASVSSVLGLFPSSHPSSFQRGSDPARRALFHGHP